MGEYIIQESTLADIADAIRVKCGTTSPINPTQMGDYIRMIPDTVLPGSIVMAVPRTMHIGSFDAVSNLNVDHYSSIRVSGNNIVGGPNNSVYENIHFGTDVDNDTMFNNLKNRYVKLEDDTVLYVPSNARYSISNSSPHNVVFYDVNPVFIVLNSVNN